MNPKIISELKRAGERWLDEMAAFCKVHGAPHCYQNWTPETLRDYLSFHLHQGTLAWTGELEHGKVSHFTGVGIMWQCNYVDIVQGESEGGYQFNWQPTNPQGDSLFLADFVCTIPAALPSLITAFYQRRTAWAGLKWFTYRPIKNSKLKIQKQLIRLNRRYLQLLTLRLRRKPFYV